MIKIDTDSADKLILQLKLLPHEMGVGVRKAVNQSVLMVQADAKRSIVKISGGRVYMRTKAKRGKRGFGRGSRTGIHIASKPGDAPNKDTGTLLKYIVVSKTKGNTRKGYSASVRAMVPYAIDLEYGTSRVKARPFMGPALAKNSKKIQTLIGNAVRSQL